MTKYFSDSLQGLLDDADAWFFNYFTSETFDSQNEIMNSVIALIDENDCRILNECKNSLVTVYEWPKEYVEQNYNEIVEHIKKTGNYFLKNVISLNWKV